MGLSYRIVPRKREINMTKETLNLIKELFEMIKNQKEYSDILNQQIVNINAQLETLRKKK